MRPTAWTSDLATLAGVLGASGLVFDAPAAAAAAAGLAALLGFRGVLFLYRSARVADGLVIERRLERPNVRQGEPVGVVTRVTAPPVAGLAVTITDLPPASAAYDPNELRAISGSIRYYVRLMVPGRVAFRGVLLEASDQFFSARLSLTAPAYAGEGVTVLPAGASRLGRGAGSSTGERELDRPSVLRGQGVQSYRPFRSGDDPAQVDWKLSAKYGRYYVREHTRWAGGPPLLVVDLPPEDAEGAGAVLSAAGDAVEASLREFGTVSLLVVAGGEVVAFSDRETDLASLVHLLAVRAGEPADPLYRAWDPAALWKRQREAERSAAAPFQRLAAALRANLAGGGGTPFEREIARTLTDSRHRDVILYSAGAGDASHLAVIGGAMRRRGQRLRFMLPAIDPAGAARLAPYGSVEAL